MNSNKVQRKWQESQVFGYDGVVYGDGRITLADVYPHINGNGYTQNPVVDCHVEGIEKYNDDAWVSVDIYHGSFIHDNQKIVFGSGAMGSDGFIASTTLDGQLNWSMFFDFSNPINKAEVVENTLICHGDTGCQIEINLLALHEVKITWDDYAK